MKKPAQIVIAIAALLMLALPLAAVGAQPVTSSITVTEDDINSAYRVTNPWRRSVSDLSVDLQPGQVVISATLTHRRTAYEMTAVYVPEIRGGRIYWTLASATANGQPASQDLVNQINAAMSSAWRSYIRQQAGPGRVQSIEITDADITIVYAAGR